MKIVIRGESGTGKTSLLNRFLGQPLTELYEPTPGINIGVLPWKYEGRNETIFDF